MKIETLNQKDRIPINCPKCDTVLNKIYCRYEDLEMDENNDPFDLKVFKCQKCAVVYAYFIDNPNEYDDSTDNTEPMNDHSYPMQKPKSVPKRCGSIYSRSIKEHEDRTEELNKIILSKITQLYGVGLSLVTVNLARGEVVRYTQGKTTTKKLTSLLVAAIYAKANSITTDGGCLWKHKGEGVTERQLEKIFGVSRKTIHKYENKFYNPIK